MKVLDIIVTFLLVIGALNWGWVGFFGYNLIGATFGEASAYARVIYSAIGLCGLYEAYNFTYGYKGLYHRWCELPSTSAAHYH
jgi:uncharacterized protein